MQITRVVNLQDWLKIQVLFALGKPKLNTTQLTALIRFRWEIIKNNHLNRIRADNCWFALVYLKFNHPLENKIRDRINRKNRFFFLFYIIAWFFFFPTFSLIAPPFYHPHFFSIFIQSRVEINSRFISNGPPNLKLESDFSCIHQDRNSMTEKNNEWNVFFRIFPLTFNTFILISFPMVEALMNLFLQ